MVAYGHEVSVVAGRYAYMSRTALAQADATAGGYRIVRTSSGNERSRSRLARILSYGVFTATSLFGLARTARADIVYASSPPIFPMITGWAWARLTGARFVLEVRDLWPESAVVLGVISNRALIGLTERLEAFLYRRSDGIVALTHGIADTIRTRHDPAAPIHVARCAVDPESLKVAPGTREAVRARHGWGDACVALYLGTIGYANDLECVLAAARQTGSSSPVRIVVLGDGVHRQALQEAARDLDNVEFLDAVAKQEVADYLAAADIALCPLRDLPLFDGAVPTKLLDYLAAGLPVIAPQLKEIGEIITDYEAGALYPPGDAAALASILENLAARPELRHRLGEGAARAIAGEFLLDERAAHLDAFLRRVAEGAHAD